MMERLFDHPFILTGLIVAVILIIAYFVEHAPGGFKSFHYEYINSDGDKQEAIWCGIPSRRQAYCELEDGTKVLDIREYRKVIDE